jgi:hypothetical protein
VRLSRSRAARHLQLAQRRGDLRAQLVVDVAVERRGRLVGVALEQVELDAVDDQAAERHPRVGELAAEEDGLLDRLALGARDDEERRRRIGRAAS